MTLTKFGDPFNDIFPSWIDYDRHDKWYGGLTPSLYGKSNYRWNEDDKTYTLEAVMPGLTKKDISITFKSDKLTDQFLGKILDKKIPIDGNFSKKF